MSIPLQNLTIRGESVQSLYATYLRAGFLVNRRYQRKLVWTIDEKRRFADSLRKGFPVPLLLLTETPTQNSFVYEIIDGMQRLNAMFSFMEGDVALDEHYFDLGTIPETKALLDSGEIVQKTPVLPVDDCRRIVTYQLPLSVSRNKTPDEIDEIFRRINSYGRHLSRQELRQAGATGLFPQLVRKLASRIRGDVSAHDQLDLALMKEISITNVKLAYGISVDTLFWVANKVLRADQVRESRDEELIADIIAYNVLSPRPPSSSTILDDYYGISRRSDQSERLAEIETAVKKHGEAELIRRYMMVHEELRTTIVQSGKPFNALMFAGAGARVPRYFQVVFLAMYQLLVNENMQVADRTKLAQVLDGIGKNVNIAEGGNWSAENRQTNVDAVVGIIKRAFKKKGKTDVAYDSWATELENILMQSRTENSLYDLKQGLHSLTSPYNAEQNIVPKVAKTLAAMANAGPGATGYIIIGATDEPSTALAVKTARGIEAERFNGFYILGIDHEATHKLYKKGLDSYLQKFVQDFTSQPLSGTHRDQILRDIRLVSYFSRHLLVLKVDGTSDPCSYDGEFFERHGPHNAKVEGEALKNFFKRFYTGRE